MKDLYEVLDSLEIPYELYEHPAFFTCEESDAWYQKHLDGTSGESKNLFLRDKKGDKHYLVVVESSKRLDLKELAKKLGESKLSFASEERLKKYLNLSPGSVSVFALLYENAKDVQVMMDADLLGYKKLHYHPPGRNDQTVVVSTEDLKKFLGFVGNPLEVMEL